MNHSDDSSPLVSIVALNYNNGRYVIETLNSIAEQTYPYTELIVVDDCSTDGSDNKIEQWLESYTKPYKFIRSPKNEGVCATCNKGYKAAKGKYISSIATDDVMLPEKIARQVQFFESLPDEVKMIYGDAYLIDENSNKLFGTFIQKYRKFDEVPSGDIFEDLLEGNFIPTMSIMCRTSAFEVIGYFDETLSYEDYDMWLRIAKKHKIVFYPEMLVNYRKRNGSLMQTFGVSLWYDNAAKILLKHSDNEKVKKKIRDITRDFYFRGYSCHELLRCKIKDKGFVFYCIKMRLPPKLTKAILAILGRL